jgi:EmrB/QacA subfamily drug resistance transporter
VSSVGTIAPPVDTIAPPAGGDRQHARRWWILAVIATAQLMVVLDATIVNIALPSAQKALHFSNSERQWIVTAYTLAFGGLLLVGGRIGDLFGRKPTLVAGLIGFAAASAIGGVAPSFGVLVGARALQGGFGALLAPTALSLLSTTFGDPSERGKAFGIYGSVAGSGAAVGLLLGGVLTEYLSWRWCLYVNLAFAIPTALAALSLLDNGLHAAKPRIDVPGTLTAVLGLFALVYGFNHAETASWGSPTTLSFIAAGIALLAGFAAIQRRAEHPLLPPRIVLDRDRGGSYLAVGIVGVGMFGAFFLLTYYLQQTLGYSPIHTGFAFLPLVGAVIATATTSSAVLLQRTGPRPLMTVGMVLAAVGMVLLTKLAVDSTYAEHVLPGLILIGMGLGFTMAPAMNTATLGVSSADAGVASASVNTMQQVGGSLGTALFSTLSASAATGYLAGNHPGAGVVAQATVHGYTVAFWWAAAIFAAGAIVCGLVLRSGAPKLEPDATPALAASN